MSNEYNKEQGAHLPVGTQVILRAVVGSTVHGTAVNAQDDRDEMAIGIEPREYVIGLRHWETSVHRTQPEGVRSGPGDLDLVIHSLRKFCRLAAKGNPSILLPLFVPPPFVVSQNHLGEALCVRRDMFLSRHVGTSFLGYMQAQRGRLEGTRGGRHGGGGRQDLIDAYGFDTKYAGHIIRLGYQGVQLLETGHLSLPMRPAEAEEVCGIRTGKWELNHVLTLAGQLERRLKDLLDTTALPPEPNYGAIDAFLVHAYTTAWNQRSEDIADRMNWGD